MMSLEALIDTEKAAVPPVETNVDMSSNGELDEDDEEAQKERAVQAEIDKFRVRQQARDKEEEEQRRVRVESRIRSLRERQERMVRATAEETAAAEKRVEDEKMLMENDSDNKGDDGLDRSKRVRGDAEGVDEEEAKRRRQGVMDLVSGDILENQLSNKGGSFKVGLKLSAAVQSKKVSSVGSVGLFNGAGDDDEARPMRSIVPLDYSAEEMESVEAVKKERQRQMIDQIPTEKSTLFAYPIDWVAVESLGLADTSLRPWIVRKIVEYLGEEETTLIEFIVAKVRNRCEPSVLLGELEAVLEEDAEQFVVKLWRMLIFSVIAAANS
jgi:RNA-binding protein 25